LENPLICDRLHSIRDRPICSSTLLTGATHLSENNHRRSPYAPWLLLLLFLGQFAVSFRPNALSWDGVFYYAYARSALFDGDLNLGNDLVLSYKVTPGTDFAAQRFEEHRTATGRVANEFAVGTSLLWLPWLAVIYAFVRLASLIGLGPAAVTGYEWCFTWGMAAVTSVYGWLAILVGFRLARRIVGDWIALAACATVMFATPLVYYQFREPFYAHPVSAMTIALFLNAWWQTTRTRRSLSFALVLGALGGLATLVRTQNITYLILPALTDMAIAGDAVRARRWHELRRTVAHFLCVVAGVLVVSTLQLSVWRVLYGRPLIVPQGAAFVDWCAPWMGHVVFSPFHGLLPWLPLSVPAIAGLIALARRDPTRSIPLVSAFLVQIYVNSSVRDWFGAGGYGARRFSNTLIILIVGYSCLIGWGKKRWHRLLAVGLSLMLVFHQWLIVRYGFVDQIGGRVVSMSPHYEWQADTIGTFLRQLAGYASQAARAPIDTLVLPGSPLRRILASPSSVLRQLLLLAGVLAILHGLGAGWRGLANRYTKGTLLRRLALFSVMALAVSANWWLLTRA
jgi:hypothetical protein